MGQASQVCTLIPSSNSTMVVLVASDSKTICVDDKVIMCSSVLRRKMQGMFQLDRSVSAVRRVSSQSEIPMTPFM